MSGLVLGILKNERFKVGEVYVRVVALKSATEFTLEVEGAMLQRYEVNDKTRTEILPQVYVRACEGDRVYRAVFTVEAPPTVRIQRLSKYPAAERFGITGQSTESV